MAILPVGDLQANVVLHPDYSDEDGVHGDGDEVHGSVVMPKLGNATAKFVALLRLVGTIANDYSEPSLVVQHGSYCTGPGRLIRSPYSQRSRHTMTLRYPEVCDT